VTDPDPATGYIVHIRGPDTDEPPRTRTKLASQFRRWMVAPEWLAEITHAKYDKPRRIAGNGKAWGDLIDPEDDVAAQQELNEMAVSKRRKGKQSVGSSKRVRLETGQEAGPSNVAQGG
jgi:hypothetical protein